MEGFLIEDERGRHTAVFLLLLSFLLLLGLALSWSTPLPAVPDLTPYPWVYWRDGRPPAADETLVSLIVVGDVLLGRGVAAQPDPLRLVAPWLQTADLVLGNLEGVVVNQTAGEIEFAERGSGNGERITLLMPPTAVFQLRAAGFDLLGLANNHSLDAGVGGVATTAARLRQVGLTPLGLAEPEAAPAHIRIANSTRLAFLAFNLVPDPAVTPCRPAPLRPCPQPWDDEAGPAAIAAAQAQADGVVVSVHWGLEYETRPSPTQERLAQAMVDAGADLVVGHHPHVAQPLVVVGDQVIAYSLGNFVFDQMGPETGQGLALHALFDTAGLRAVQLLPIWAGWQPRLMTPAEAAPLLARVLPPPPRLAFACDPLACVATDAPPPDGSTRFYAGQIDLTGDGAPETVRREGEQVVVYEGGTAVWRSPATWRVVDVALGDPNDDGRYEIMLAIWRQDEAGYERSQPYIVGYRGGRYDLLWGGRPVVDPILALTLADVDEDGVTELIVLTESADGDGRRVGVWQWQGWSFSLQWQSAPGAFGDLQVVEGVGERPFISVSEAMTAVP